MATAKGRQIYKFFNSHHILCQQITAVHLSRQSWLWLDSVPIPTIWQWRHTWTLYSSYPNIRSVTNFCLSPCRWGCSRQFSSKYCLLNTLCIKTMKGNEFPSQPNVLMSSATGRLAFQKFPWNCLEASLSNYVYHEPTVFSQTAYILQALPYSYGTDTYQTFRNKIKLKLNFKYLGNASNRKGRGGDGGEEKRKEEHILANLAV